MRKNYTTYYLLLLFSGEAVSKWGPDSDINPEEMGHYVEGDILFPNTNDSARNGLKAASAHWPKGVVPYEIGPYFSK